MKRTLTLALVLVFMLWGADSMLSQQNAEDQKFQKILDNYFDELWKFYPTAATLAGFHKYNDKLEDIDSKSIDKHHDALDEFNQEFVAKVDRTMLSPEFQIDHEIMINALDFELMQHEMLLPWEYNPLFYNSIFLNAIRSLTSKDFAPLDTRAKSVVERLKNLPKLIKQAKENLKTSAEIYTDTAIKQFPAIMNFYRNELPQWIAQAPSAHQSNLQSNRAKVVAAFEDYQSFLKNELFPRSTGNFRTLEAHARLMRISLLNTIPLQDLIARAQADYKNIRREMFLVVIPFYKIMDPKFDIEKPPASLTEDQLFNTTITNVLDHIKTDHVTQEEFLDEVKSVASRIKEFFAAKDMVEFPAVELNIESMPVEFQGKSWTHLSGPGIYNTSGSYTCQVYPLTNEWTNEQIESMLQEYNNDMLPFWVIRNVYPGQFVPVYYTAQYPSLLRKFYPNQPLLKGWPLLLEEKLIKSGYEYYDLKLRLNQLKLQLRAVIDFIVDFNVHEGSWTKEQALAYMTRGGFMTEGEAERKWNKILLNPGDAAYAYVGYQEILDIEKAYKQLKGEAYSQKEFLRQILSYGALPLHHLKNKIMTQ